MLTNPTLVFLLGVDLPTLLLVFIILAIPGFFLWRALLNNLTKKGPRGINIAAIIMGAVQSPIFALIIGTLIYSSVVGMESSSQLPEEKEPAAQVDNDTTEIDVISVSPDKCKVLMENEHVRVLQYTLAPGEKDNPHTHPPKTYYVLEGGMLRIYPDNEQPFDAEERTGTVEWGDHVGMHYVENIGTTTVKLLVTEVKAAR